MRMTPVMLIVGGLLVFWASTFAMIGMALMSMDETPSDTWRPLSPDEAAGLALYNANGCSYCHSQYVRVFDWDYGAERIAQGGDYGGREPIILGTERWGPDLSQEGGLHPDDWHLAHFVNPRYVRPVSMMPSWEFLGGEKLRLLTAYMQGEGMRAADQRVERQAYWQKQARDAYARGPDKNIEWLHGEVPRVWREMPNPYPAETQNLSRGRKMYQQFCINCHGPMGDGLGPAAKYLDPQPLNFTTLRRHLVDNKYIGGIFYYQIMNGITGTAMPYFKKDLESAKIWDISNYLAVQFLGYTDANIEPRGIDVSEETFWKNTYEPPPANEVAK